MPLQAGQLQAIAAFKLSVMVQNVSLIDWSRVFAELIFRLYKGFKGIPPCSVGVAVLHVQPFHTLHLQPCHVIFYVILNDSWLNPIVCNVSGDCVTESKPNSTWSNTLANSAREQSFTLEWGRAEFTEALPCW